MMLRARFESFIADCIAILENDELYAAKLMRLKEIVRQQYTQVMTETLLGFFYYNDSYHDSSFHLYNESDEQKLGYVIDALLEGYEKECRTYIFNVCETGDRDIISRTIQVPHDATVASLGYAVLASLGYENHEFYMSHDVDGLYPVYSDHELHFTEQDPFETPVSGIHFHDIPMEMSYCGSTIRIWLEDVETVENIYAPQHYKAWDRNGVELDMDIKAVVEKWLYEHEASLLVPYDEIDLDELAEENIEDDM